MKIKIHGYKVFFAIVDFLLIFASFFLALYAANPSLELPILHLIVREFEITIVFIILCTIFIFFFRINNLYHINVILTNALQTTALIKSFCYGFVFVILIEYIFKFSSLLNSRLYMIIFLVFAFGSVVIIRLVILRTFYIIFSRRYFIKRNAIIIGAGKTGKMVLTKLIVENVYGIFIVGFVDDALPVGTIIVKGKSVLGSVSELSKVIDEYKISEIIIAINNITYDRILEILDLAKRQNVFIKVTSDLFDIIPMELRIEQYSGVSMINISPQFSNKLILPAKRIIDLIVAALALFFLSPIFLAIGIIVKISSKGPILYSQTRIGKDGKPFNFYKFRSMLVSKDDDIERQKKMTDFVRDGNNQNSADTKIVDESRITWIGRIIRKTSFDELPQLYNVLKGDMSLVGPRPCLPYEYDLYNNWQKKRTSVLPGCTGVWQVYGRSKVCFKDSVVLDIYYINNISPWFDLQLILKTIPVMLFLKGGK